MSTLAQPRATLDDLYKVEGKAELIAGRIKHFMPSGATPTSVAFEIAISLRGHCRRIRRGVAFPDGIGYAMVPPLPSGRESFSPDASYYDGPMPADLMRFIVGPPTFGAEVRSEGDYGPKAELEMAFKRDEYFQAGTQAVWDVDPIAETVTLYRASDLTTPVVFRRGDTAHAEPAVPGWTMPVDAIFG